MEMTGERRINATRDQVWAALNDPAVLQKAIPGCETVERVGDDQFTAKLALKLGPMSAKLAGKVTLSNVVAPESYTISGEGQGGAMGFAKGAANVALAADGPDYTILRYSVNAQVGGKMAQLGARLIDSTAKSMSDQFFDRFAAQLNPAVPAPVAVPIEVAPARPVGPDIWQQAGRWLFQPIMGFPPQVVFGLAAFAFVLLMMYATG